ncbi:hypothetical protein N0V83_007959 [Neocucurbitaria cava]|uniref:Uncharacterized protein n=1 Tax=Neocucurbitaria cava TaxID=798079 RepID=A0A9W8Y588_9PLEO|nr:hypothetical protein N0V83_007959 [Neocucurbitaria cava]
MAPEKPAKALKQRKTPTTVSDFTILPLSLSTLPGLPAQHSDSSAKHYLYIKPHSPSIPSADDERSLFLANVPIDATEKNLRALFADGQLGGAMVERVHFNGTVPAERMHKRFKADSKSSDATEQRGKKRKRNHELEEKMVAEGVLEDDDSALPSVWKGEVRRSGSGAVVVFVDRKSARGAMKEVVKAVKEGRTVAWKSSGEGLGVELVRGGRAGPARIAEAEKKKAELEERRRNNGVKDDFYRFQNREKRKEREGELKRRFEEDRRRVGEMRERRGAVRPEV